MNVYFWCCLRHRDMVLLGKKQFAKFPPPDIWYPPGGELEAVDGIEKLVRNKEFDCSKLVEILVRVVRTDFNVDIKSIKSIIPKYRLEPRLGVLPISDDQNKEFLFLEYICDYKGRANIPSWRYAETRWVRLAELNTFPMLEPQKQFFKDIGVL